MVSIHEKVTFYHKINKNMLFTQQWLELEITMTQK